MNLTNPFHLQTPTLPIRVSLSHHSPTLRISSRFSDSRSRIPARDRAIEFGKHKGKLLGALPSKYLKWISANLRARDFEDWAKLADEVLRDPIYQDRLEWEFAENVLHGNRAAFAGKGSAVSELREISERFGWDDDDKAAWSKLDFALLGTSKTGRIPRLSPATESVTPAKGEGILGNRASRIRRKEEVAEKERGSLGNGVSRARREEEMTEKGRGSLGNGASGGETEMAEKVKIHNPFPGRERLLKDVLHGRRFL